MGSTSWHQIKPVLYAVLDTAPHEREAVLAQKCGDDSAMRHQIERYLELEEEADELFDESPHALLAEPTAATLGPGGDPYLGRIIDRYRIRKILGRGGMGTVYLADREGHFDQKVALKVIKRGMDTVEVVQRFEVERQILANLQHENIARLLDGGSTDDGLPFFVMEHIDGVPLDEYCDSKQLGIRARLDLFLKVCRAVEEAHRRLIVHRDLKPSNLLVTKDGSPKLLDFGIAKLLADESSTALANTLPERRVMTARYASPEQVRGEPITTASDVYSLGVVLFQLLTGHSPYRLETLTDDVVAQRVQEEDPKKPSTVIGLDEEISTGQGKPMRIDSLEVARTRGSELQTLKSRLAGDLDAIVLKALAKEPERRYGSVEQLAEDIQRHLTGLPVKAVPPTATYRTKRYLRRNAIPVAIASILFALLVGYAGTVSVLWANAEEARDKAELSEANAEEARDKAELSEAEANQTSTLLGSIFSGAKPDSERGAQNSFLDILKAGREKVDALESPDIKARLFRILGDTYRSLGDRDEAEDLFESCIDILEARYPDEPHHSIPCQFHLGSLRMDQGKLEEARDIVEEALKITEDFHGGADDLSLAKALNTLGLVYYKLNLIEPAGQYLSRAFDMKRRLVQSNADQGSLLDESAMFVGQSNLAAVWLKLGRHQEAVELSLESVARQRELPRDKKSYEVFAGSLSTLGRGYFAIGQPADALNAFEEVAEIRRRLRPGMHISVAGALLNQSKALLQLSRFQAAIKIAAEGEVILDAQPKPQHRLLGIVRTTAAEALAAQGAFDKCLEKADTALKALSLGSKIEAWRIPMAQHTRASCLSRVTDPGLGEPLLLEALHVMEEEGAPSVDLRRAIARTAEHYEWIGDAEAAKSYRTRLQDEGS